MIPKIKLDPKDSEFKVLRDFKRSLICYKDDFVITGDYIVGFYCKSSKLNNIPRYLKYTYSTPCFSIFSNNTKSIAEWKFENNDWCETKTLMLSDVILLEYEKWSYLNMNNLYEFLEYISKKYYINIDINEFYSSKYWKNVANKVRNCKNNENVYKLYNIYRLFIIFGIFGVVYFIWRYL